MSDVGAPARITAKSDSKTVTARTARWSHDPSVRMFWFDPAEAKGTMTDLGAYDAAGAPLTRGHVEVFCNMSHADSASWRHCCQVASRSR